MSMYPTLFVPCFNEEQAEKAATVAAPVAGALGSLAVGCHGTPPPHVAVPAVYPLESGAHIQEIIDAVSKANAAETENIKESFKKGCAAANLEFAEPANLDARVSASWRSPIGLIPEVYVSEAMTCDLSLVAQSEDLTSADDLSAYTAVLMGSGKPILVVPDGVTFQLPEKIIVGWNGSLEVSRAVQSALPLLKEANHATLLSVSNDEVTSPELPAAIAALSRHNVRASHDQIPTSAARVSDSLQDYAKENGAGLLVLGGYSHSRIRELVLGGVTRSVLQKARMPILLCH